MAEQFTICVGTIGAGVWFSPDSGDHWRRSKMALPFHAEPGEIQIRALALSPHDPHQVYAGSEAGLYRSNDNGASFELVSSPMDGMQIWSVAVNPQDPHEIYAGTKPPAVFRSRDGGARWERLEIPIAKECLAGPPKVTNVVFDPRDARTIWMSVEIDGVYRSRDGGNSWTHCPPLGDKPLNQDVHGLAVRPGRPTEIVVTTPDGVWRSANEGESWSLHSFPRFAERDTISYCRGVAIMPSNVDVMFVANGDFIPGKRGAIQRTTDGGATWKKCALEIEPNSTMYWFGVNPANPEVVVANSLHGYLYLSRDGGESWNKLRREFGEIRALAWLPN